MKHVLKGFYIFIKSSAANQPKNEFHGKCWYRSGLPVIESIFMYDQSAWVTTYIKNIDYKYKYYGGAARTTGRVVKAIKGFINPLNAISIDIHGIPIISNMPLELLTSTELLATRKFALGDKNTMFVPLAKEATNIKINGGINLHQFGDVNVVVEILPSKNGINVEKIINKGSLTLDIIGQNLNVIKNDKGASLEKLYFS